MTTMNWKRLVAAAVVAVGVPAAMLLVGVMACGPDFEPEVFVPEHQPESPKLYAEGHLGVVQPGYFHAELVVAYRYLSGANLSDAEKAVYAGGMDSTPNEHEYGAGPAVDWLKARHGVGDLPTDNQPPFYMFDQDRSFKKAADGSTEVDFELNCTDGAFVTAVATLQQRTQQWGAKSAALLEWVHGQDAVFSNCNKEGTMPDAAKLEWPLLLRQDRAYQIAAAKFYSANYDGAIADFEAIGKDKASSWSTWGEYLAARAEVRKAASVPASPGYNPTLGNFDTAGLKAAQSRLQRLEQQTKDSGVKHAAEAELGFVEVRLNPGKRLDEVSGALSGPKADADFAQDLADLDYLMDRGVAGDSDLARWIKNMQTDSLNPSKNDVSGAAKPSLNALSVWRAGHSVPWLVAAMAESKGTDAEGTELMAAAAAVKPESPAYATVNFYRIGWLLGAKKKAEARTLADTVLAGLGPQTMASTRNAFLAERIQTARSLAEFLADAPRTVLDAGSSAAVELCGAWESDKCVAKIPPQQFDADVATSMNVLMPLAMWEQAAESNTLPKNLRDGVAWAAWMRALGMGDAAGVKQMASLLPPAVQKTAGDSDGFPATLALLRNPGLRPYLEQGVQRSATFAELDNFRDNWWCGRWTDGGGNGGLDPNDSNAPQAKPRADFLTAEEKKQAADEAAKLNALPSGTVWMGQQVIAYVQAHPGDKDGAEALALTVRATHFSCSGESDTNGQKALSKEAFEMLHRLYPKSEWAIKTKYYY